MPRGRCESTAFLFDVSWSRHDAHLGRIMQRNLLQRHYSWWKCDEFRWCRNLEQCQLWIPDGRNIHDLGRVKIFGTHTFLMHSQKRE